jgi:hypothetical protein
MFRNDGFRPNPAQMHSRILLFLGLMQILMGLMSFCSSDAMAAELSKRDIEVIARTIKFVEPVIAAKASVAIIFDPSNPESVRQALTIEQALASEDILKLMPVVAQRVPVNNLAINNVRIAFLTTGVEAAAPRINEVTSANGVITVSSDKACAQRGHCVFSVSSEPSVSLWFSRAAASAAGLIFSPALLMLVKKV